jgi:hypothetical protein
MASRPEFDLANLAAGSKIATWISVALRTDGEWWKLPLLAARGVYM